MIPTLLELTTSQLLALADAARRGALESPIEISLSSYCPDVLRKPLAAELEMAANRGLQGDALAILLETLVQDRGTRQSSSLQADLVWTGPDMPGLRPRDTRIVVHELFRKARKSVLVSTFALFDGKDLFAPLHETWEQFPDMTVKLFVDIKRGESNQSDTAIIERFRQDFQSYHWPWERVPEVYYDPRNLAMQTSERACLHAKCVIVDDADVFLTSANLTEAAQQRNIEAGIVVKGIALAEELTSLFAKMASVGHLRRLVLN